VSAIYADTSALVKLLIAEPESFAVAALLARATLVTSELAAVELACTARRRALPHAGPQIEAILEAAELLPLDAETLASARSSPTRPPLRALDALHLAGAGRLRSRVPDLAFACYDADLSAAAAAAGFEVLAPGR
jgi:predicted nucleic acid-binding protein